MAQTFTVNTMWKKGSRPIQVTNSSSKFHVDNKDQTFVVSALLGKDFHKSSKAKNPPTGADSYIHCSATNTLYALKASAVTSNQDSVADAVKGTDPEPVQITFNVLGIGSVNKNVHKF